MPTCGYCVIVFDISREPTVCPGDAFACVMRAYGSEFEIGRATSGNEVPSSLQSSMDFASNLWQYLDYIRLRSGQWCILVFS